MVKCILSAFVLLASCTGRPDVLGLDENKNGIADAVDSYIAGVSLTETKRLKLEQLAAAYQKSLSVDLSNLKQVEEANTAISSAVSDVFVTLTNKNGSRAAAEMIQSIENLTLNSEYKRSMYASFSQSADALAKEPESCQQWTKTGDNSSQSNLEKATDNS